jgi:hypothetical protein
MIKYTFKDEPLTIKNKAKAAPQKIGEALATIAAASNGHLTPKAVVSEARNNRSVLHRHFEWDDAVAAEAFRLDQARTLIRSIRVVDDENDETPPAWVSISDKGGTSYRTLQDVLDSADLQAQALKQAERDLDAFQKRYRQFEDICDVIKSAREIISKRRDNLESRPHA